MKTFLLTERIGPNFLPCGFVRGENIEKAAKKTGMSIGLTRPNLPKNSVWLHNATGKDYLFSPIGEIFSPADIK